MNKLMEAVPLDGIVWTFNLHFSVEISKLKSSAGHQKLFDQTMHNYAKGEREEDRGIAKSENQPLLTHHREINSKQLRQGTFCPF